jgi:hypothetical protein
VRPGLPITTYENLEPIQTWIDESVLHSILAGLLLALGLAWGRHLMHRLWQHSLSQQAAGAIEGAARMGLAVEPPGWGPRRRARGRWSGLDCCLTWSGGLWGSRTTLDLGDRRRVLPLIRTRGSLEQALQDLREELGPPRPAGAAQP